jgi:hypothetical protein
VRLSRLPQVTDGLGTRQRAHAMHAPIGVVGMHPSAPGSGGALARTWRRPIGLTREILGRHRPVGWAGRKSLGIAHETFVIGFPREPVPVRGPGFSLLRRVRCGLRDLLSPNTVKPPRRNCSIDRVMGLARWGVRRGVANVA